MGVRDLGMIEVPSVDRAETTAVAERDNSAGPGTPPYGLVSPPSLRPAKKEAPGQVPR